MWQQTQSEKREQLFPPGSAWKKALTPPQRETKAKKAEANHLLRMQVGLCVLLVGAVLLLRQLNKPVYEEFRREYAALTQQEGADGERLLQFAGSLAAGVQKKAEEFFRENALESTVERDASHAPDWDSTHLAAAFGKIKTVPTGSSQAALPVEFQPIAPLTDAWQVSSAFGWRKSPFAPKKTSEFHTGVDLGTGEGELVVAAADGTVAEARRSQSYGNCVKLLHGDGLATRYCHMQYIFVHPGDFVKQGDRLGTVGQTGAATGPHLHLELQWNDVCYDPQKSFSLA